MKISSLACIINFLIVQYSYSYKDIIQYIGVNSAIRHPRVRFRPDTPPSAHYCYDKVFSSFIGTIFSTDSSDSAVSEDAEIEPKKAVSSGWRSAYLTTDFLVANCARALACTAAGVWVQSWYFKPSIGARSREGIGLSYQPARLYWLAELISWNGSWSP
jgi:hypothetical protein